MLRIGGTSLKGILQFRNSRFFSAAENAPLWKKLHSDVEDALNNPAELINFSCISDTLNLLSAEEIQSNPSIQEISTINSEIMACLSEINQLQTERAHLLTLRNESKEERNSEVLGIMCACFFGIFTIAVHPVFAIGLIPAFRSVTKTKKAEGKRIEAMERISEINNILKGHNDFVHRGKIALAETERIKPFH